MTSSHDRFASSLACEARHGGDRANDTTTLPMTRPTATPTATGSVIA
jgi:hypothetical protein